MCAMGPGFLP